MPGSASSRPAPSHLAPAGAGASQRMTPVPSAGRPPRVVVFADAGVGIGLGHLVRCAGFTTALCACGADVWFCAPRESGVHLADDLLSVPPIAIGASAEALQEACSEFGAELLVVDSYRIPREDRLALTMHGLVLVSFDDNGPHSVGASVVINGSPGAHDIEYAAPEDALRLLGPAYQVFRPEFATVPERGYSDAMRRLLVMVGGGDHLGILPGLIEQFGIIMAERPDLQIDVVAGPYTDAVYSGYGDRLRVLSRVTDARSAMLSADLAVSAGGQTILELVRCGTPTLGYSVGEDQLPNLRALARAGAITWCGSAGEPGWLTEMTAHLIYLLDHASRRVELGRRAANVFDGAGAERVAKEIYGLLNTDISKP